MRVMLPFLSRTRRLRRTRADQRLPPVLLVGLGTQCARGRVTFDERPRSDEGIEVVPDASAQGVMRYQRCLVARLGRARDRAFDRELRGMRKDEQFIGRGGRLW